MYSQWSFTKRIIDYIIIYVYLSCEKEEVFDSCYLYLDTHLLLHLFEHLIIPLQKGDLTLHTTL